MCLLWDHIGGWSQEARIEFARSLIEGGCVYAVCGGPQSDDWHDAFDEAAIGLTERGRRGNWTEKDVMTTSHLQEQLDDVAYFFAVVATTSDDAPLNKYLVLHVGSGLEVQAIEKAVKRYVQQPAA